MLNCHTINIAASDDSKIDLFTEFRNAKLKCPLNFF